MPSAGTMTIGALVRALADEFPDLTISKVRFLEAEGLVAPLRTAGGYREFTDADLDRVRWVLRTQRDRYWPLARIRAALADADRGLEPGSAGASVPEPDDREDEGAVDPDGLLARGALRLTADELAAASGSSPADLAELAEHGLLRHRADGTFDEHDLRVARAAAGLAAFGIGARHLRAVRTAADREAGLIEQATAGLRGGAAVAARTAALGHALALHAALLRGAVEEHS